MVYEVMKRIISQEIPKEVINSDRYEWNPYANTLSQARNELEGTPESPARYQKMLNNFNAMQRIDKYTGNTYIDRKFTEDMEIDVNDVEALFDQFLSAPELKEVGKIISKRLGRANPYPVSRCGNDGKEATGHLTETRIQPRSCPISGG